MNAEVAAKGIEKRVKEMLKTVADQWGWFLALGIVLIVVGLTAIIFPLTMTLAAEQFFGWLILLSGVAQSVHAFRVKSWGGFLLDLLIGVLYVLAGIALVSAPLTGMFTLTLLLIALFVATGLFEGALAFRLRPASGWGWVLASGIASLAVGLLIWAELPSSALWAIGLLIGIKFIMGGWSFVSMALTGRRLGAAR